MNDAEIFDAGAVQLHKGGVPPAARLAYRTCGGLSPQRDNAILFHT